MFVNSSELFQVQRCGLSDKCFWLNRSDAPDLLTCIGYGYQAGILLLMS